MRALPCLLAMSIASACGSSAPPPGAPAPASPPESGETGAAAATDTLQPPFGADDLRRAFVVGFTLRYKIVQAGKPPRIEEWKVTAADAESCTLHVKVFAEDGATLVEDQGPGSSKWTELETHGRFPAALTTRKDAAVDVPAGHFDTWYFEVRPAKPGDPTRRFHFARTLPGPPVWMEVSGDGTVIISMQLVSRSDHVAPGK